MTIRILIGDVREQLRTLAADSIHCCVTSPPYWGLRDYGVAGQIGLEATPAEFIEVMVDVFEEVRRVLRPDGTCWINMGDSYAAGGQGAGSGPCKQDTNGGTLRLDRPRKAPAGLKPKDLCMMPHRLAIALQDAGWWVRQDIVWAKPNPMPESIKDRCTKSHEYIFLLTKSAQYFYDADAIREPVVGDPDASRNRFDTKDYDVPGQKPQKRTSRKPSFGSGISKPDYDERKMVDRTDGISRPPITMTDRVYHPGGRNKRSVWTFATHSFAEAHFATFPPELPETCIKAGCPPPGGIVLDPFFGAGTTGLVANRLQRDCIGIELNPAYAEMARARIYRESPLFSNIEVLI